MILWGFEYCSPRLLSRSPENFVEERNLDMLLKPDWKQYFGQRDELRLDWWKLLLCETKAPRLPKMVTELG